MVAWAAHRRQRDRAGFGVPRSGDQLEVPGVGLLFLWRLDGARTDYSLQLVRLSPQGEWDGTVQHVVDGADDFVFDAPSDVLLVSRSDTKTSELLLYRRLPF
jgi:hypothetical protein